MQGNPYYEFPLHKEDSFELEHFGIKGMHWGIRRYQNQDGTLTDAGKKRYANRVAKELHRRGEEIDRIGMTETPELAEANERAIQAANLLFAARNGAEQQAAMEKVIEAGTMQAAARLSIKKMQGDAIRKGLDYYEEHEDLLRSVPASEINPKYAEMLRRFSVLSKETKKHPNKYKR